MILFEVMRFPALFINGNDFQKGYPFENGLFLTALISLIGKLVLKRFLFMKDLRENKG
jgi:hypothetical protein